MFGNCCGWKKSVCGGVVRGERQGKIAQSVACRERNIIYVSQNQITNLIGKNVRAT